MALDVTVGGEDSNSYATVAEVQDYIETHFAPQALVSKWNALVTASKEGALIKATQLLDRHVQWTGEIASDAQALSWPRVYALDRYGREIPPEIIPTFLKDFQADTALWVIDQSGQIPEVASSEYDSIRVGTIEIDFHEEGGTRRNLLPEEVIASLKPMGTYVAEIPGSAKSIYLTRV